MLSNKVGGHHGATNRQEVFGARKSLRPHKCIRNQDSLLCTEVISPDSNQQSHLSETRKYHGNLVPKQLWGHSLPSTFPSSNSYLGLMGEEKSISSGTAYPRQINMEADTESRVKRDLNDWRISPKIIALLIKDCTIDLFASRLTHQLKRYVSWRPDPSAVDKDAFTMDWWNLIAFAFLPFNLIPSVLQKAKKEHATPVLVAPPQTTQPWRPLLIELLVDYPVYLGNNLKLLQDVSRPGVMHHLFPSLRLAVWRISSKHNKTMGISEKAVELLCNNTKSSTSQTYNVSWAQWYHWCSERKSDPVSCAVSDILKFLAEQFSQGKQYRCINVLRSAIFSAHCHVDDKPVGQHSLIVRIIKGVSISRQRQPKYQHTWNVSVLTTFLASEECNKTMSMKLLSQKLCMLMTLTCPDRSSVYYQACILLDTIPMDQGNHISVWNLDFSFKGHSVRRASTSAAKGSRLSIHTILSMADWTNESTFAKFFIYLHYQLRMGQQFYLTQVHY